MTENKRFNVECDDADIWEDNHFLAVAYDHHNALKFAERLNELANENEQLKSEIKGMEELLKSYRKTVKHDAKLLADATKNGYLPPLEDWEREVIK